MASAWSISAEEAADPFRCVIKIQHDAYEFNVWIEPHELPSFAMVSAARWESRASVRIGTSAGAPVFWASEGGGVSIVAGHDDETWDFGVTIPEAVFVDIVEEVGKVSES